MSLLLLLVKLLPWVRCAVFLAHPVRTTNLIQQVTLCVEWVPGLPSWLSASDAIVLCYVPCYCSLELTLRCMGVGAAGSKRISFITEGLPWKITVNSWSIQKKTTGTTFPLYKKERERRSRPTRTLVSRYCSKFQSVSARADYAVARCLSVCHTPVFCLNG